MPSYTGTSISKKPARLKRNEKFHKLISSEYIPTIAEIIEKIEQWLNFHYAQPCPNVKDKTIGEVLEAGKGSGVDLETLDDLMMAREIKTIGRNGIKFLKNDYYDTSMYGYKGSVIIKYNLFDLSFIKVYKQNGEFMCIPKRVEPLHPLANYFGDVKDVEDLKQRTKIKKNLERKTEQNYINHLKREKAFLPMLSSDLEEKTENDRIAKLKSDIKQEIKTENSNDCFYHKFEKYEFLIKKKNLFKDEEDWIKAYKLTSEYEQIYADDKDTEDFNA